MTTGAASKPAGPPPDWIIQLVQAGMASKAAKGTPFGASPAAAGPPAFNYSAAKRDLSAASGAPAPAASAPAQQQQPQQPLAFSPFFAPYPQLQAVPPPAPQAGPPPPPPQVPLMPMMYPPMLPPFVPYWKVMG